MRSLPSWHFALVDQLSTVGSGFVSHFGSDVYTLLTIPNKEEVEA